MPSLPAASFSRRWMPLWRQKSGRGENQAGVRRHVLLQELHLVRQDATVGQDQVFGLVRHVRQVQQFHAGLLGQAVALVPVALSAGGDNVHPGVAPAARQRPDVVPRQAEETEFPCAVGAHVAVAAEQLAVVQRRHLVEAPGGKRLALDGDDRMRRDAGALAGHARDAAVESEGLFAHGPGNQVLGVVEARLLPADPAVRNTVVVQREDEGRVHDGRVILPIRPAIGNPRKFKDLQRSPTASLKPWPAAKAGTVLALILISLPLAGLRPARALRLRGRKVPNPTTVTRLPFATLATIASNTAFTASPAAVLLRLPAFAATWTRSDFVTTDGIRPPDQASVHDIGNDSRIQSPQRILGNFF